ncbi:MAG TPA: hypothetical protein PLN52_08345 [Opitutaceae bacterium]|nr:hypothetical protein [Opitutaceae bacterium]
MTLTPEQQSAVSSWITAGDNLSTVQKKLREQFSVSLTYMDLRFVVDDLNLSLKDPAPKVSAQDVTKPVAPTAPARPSAAPSAAGEDEALPSEDAELLPEEEGFDDAAALDGELPADDAAPEAGADELPAGDSSVAVEVDKVTLHPGALASGSVTFSDGVTAKWIVDNYGRPGFTEVSQPGYRPKPDDAQAFMQELSFQLQKRGF